jgi:hypothetical protein
MNSRGASTFDGVSNGTVGYHSNVVTSRYPGCETWSPTLRGEHRLRVFENRVLRRIL